MILCDGKEGESGRFTSFGHEFHEWGSGSYVAAPESAHFGIGPARNNV